MEEFATNTGFPNITIIKTGEFTVHYETQKSSGGQSYYSYAEIYKRTAGGTETLLVTSDNSSSTSVNTVQQVSVSALFFSDIALNLTDLLVVKVYCVMLS